jgi:hypothetical protein
MSLAPHPAPPADPTAPRGRYQIGLMNLIALVVLAGAAFGMARRVRDVASHTWNERIILLPLVALAFWLGVELAEGVVDRLRRPTGHDAPARGLAWRLVAILFLAAFVADQTRLLGRLEPLNATLATLGSKTQTPQIRGLQARIGVQTGKVHWRLQVLDVGLAALVFGVSAILRPRRPARPARRNVAGRRPAVAGWLFLAILAATPFLVAWSIPILRPWSMIEGLPGDDQWTSRGRVAPVVALGLMAWLGAAEWLRRDLRTGGPRSSLRSVAYRLATLACVFGATLVLAFGPLRHEPFDGNALVGPPLDTTTAALLALAAIGLAAGIVARASSPIPQESTRPRGWAAVGRAARAAALVTLLAVTFVMIFGETWGELENILEVVWPSPSWRLLIRPAIEWYYRAFEIDPRVFLWAATMTVLSVPIVARLGPRSTTKDRRPASRWLIVPTTSIAVLGVATVLAITLPYPIQTYRFWGGSVRSASLVSEALDWLEFHLHDALDTIDVELIFLAPGVYWLASRWYDSFAPPPAVPLDTLLAHGPSARRFLADWAAASVLAVAALPIAYATFVLLLG